MNRRATFAIITTIAMLSAVGTMGMTIPESYAVKAGDSYCATGENPSGNSYFCETSKKDCEQVRQSYIEAGFQIAPCYKNQGK